MVTLSDSYGDLSLEDLINDEVEELEDGPEGELDFENMFDRQEVRSFESCFGDELDEALDKLETHDPEWSDEFRDEMEAQEYFERYVEREAE